VISPTIIGVVGAVRLVVSIFGDRLS